MGKSYKDLEVKYFAAEEEGQEKEEDQDLDELAMPRNNILLSRLPAPKHVHLPNGRVFYARYYYH